MNFGLQIDLIGWFALVTILISLHGLSRGSSNRLLGPRRAVVLLAITLVAVLAAVLWSAGDNNTLLAAIMILLGVATAPFSARRPRTLSLRAEQDSILNGLSLSTIGSGLAVALLGLTGWFETNYRLDNWDLRLIAVVSVFIGVWTFASGLMLWLRLNAYLPESTPTQMQQRVGFVVLAMALGLGLLAVLFPSFARFLMIVMVLLALELGALSAFGIAITQATRVLGRHLGLLGAAIAMLGYVQESLFLLAIGSLIMAGAIQYLYLRRTIKTRATDAPRN
ncbi:NAD(P)(+) transhydrogenase (Re/Si-specific) subunit beta [Halothiobacillus sp.]|uniref:NAD(P)(+) transhydrogenase (Re/Si-specific) subunit beta n=1 Tax=Halothiobacillus sp. TaxID=1891311 RepID=UPI002AD39FD5|nr:NAD(P)(+) transhydrogenase (Re/Si-specific) subunit beta [Halothiobacillus sp.]